MEKMIEQVTPINSFPPTVHRQLRPVQVCASPVPAASLVPRRPWGKFTAEQQQQSLQQLRAEYAVLTTRADAEILQCSLSMSSSCGEMTASSNSDGNSSSSSSSSSSSNIDNSNRGNYSNSVNESSTQQQSSETVTALEWLHQLQRRSWHTMNASSADMQAPSSSNKPPLHEPAATSSIIATVMTAAELYMEALAICDEDICLHKKLAKCLEILCWTQ